MSLPGNYITVVTSNSPPIEEQRTILSLPNSIRLNENRNERSVEDFLNGVSKNNSILDDVESNSGSITLKEENSRHSSLLSRSHSEIPCDIEDDVISKPDTDNNNDNCSQTSKTNIVIFPEDSCNIKSQNSCQTDFHFINVETMTNHNSNKNSEVHLENPEKIATPTINLKKIVEHCQPKYQDKDVQINDQKSAEHEEFSNKLTQMTLLIQQKDEEIKSLSEKLQNFITKDKSRKPFSSTSSSSSSESDKSFQKKIKQKKDKKKRKKSDSIKQKEKSKTKNEQTVEDTSANKSIEKSRKESMKKENKEKSKFSEEIINDHTSGKEDFKNFESVCNVDIAKCEDPTKIYIRKKLDELESEVRRLQQANVDSILSFQMLENKDKLSSRSSNDNIITKLLTEHELLKEELQQIKWEHSKLTQPGLLMDEISHLKKDMNYLRKQNDFLKNFTKQSSRSLNHLTSSTHDIRETKDKYDGKTNRNIFNSNNSSNNIYQKLQNSHRNAFETPDMKTLLKNNIESLESPYHSTYQSFQHSAPFSGGPSYRIRKLSDSSSVLMEDVKLKSWIETTPKSYKTTFNQLPINCQGLSNQYNKEFDEESVDSYVSVTTSVTERTDDDWRQKRKNQDGNHDLLSTQDSDLSDDNTVKEILNYPAKSKLDYSFTPKTPSDLNLEDFVKFVRPGGKMSTGRVCYIGHLPGRNEVCVGLELGEDAGKHDGMFEGNRYFQCRKNRGVFISFHKIILAYKPF